MKLRDPDDYVDRDVLIDAIVDEMLYRLESTENHVKWTINGFIADILVQGGWKPLIQMDDAELQETYDLWVGGDLRVNSFFVDDKGDQLDFDLEMRHG